MTGYDPGRLGVLRTQTVRAIEALREVRSDDPAAASALAVAAAARANLEHSWLGLIDRIVRSDPMGSWSAVPPAGAPVGWRAWPTGGAGAPAPGGDLCDDVAGSAACEVGGRAAETVDNVLDWGAAVAPCREGGDDCNAAVAELAFDAAAGTVLTPVRVEVVKVLIWCMLNAVAGAMAQSPNIRPDWTNAGGTPGELPYESGGTPVPERSAPNGGNPNGGLNYGGPDCASLDFYGTDNESC